MRSAGWQPCSWTRPVQCAHRHKMPRQMFWHTYLFQLLSPPSGLTVRVSDLSIQRVREFAGDLIHVLRPRTGEFIVPGGHGHAEVDAGATVDQHNRARVRFALWFSVGFTIQNV